MTHYRETFTDLEIVEAGPHRHGIDQRLHDLVRRTGVASTRAGRLDTYRDHERGITSYVVSFKAEAWTG